MVSALSTFPWAFHQRKAASFPPGTSYTGQDPPTSKALEAAAGCSKETPGDSHLFLSTDKRACDATKHLLGHRWGGEPKLESRIQWGKGHPGSPPGCGACWSLLSTLPELANANEPELPASEGVSAEPGLTGLMSSMGTQLGTGDAAPPCLSFPPGKGLGNKPQTRPAMETRPAQD